MLSVPEGEDRHFECSIQHGAPSPHGLLMLQGPGTEAKCLTLVAHIGMGSLFWPVVACGNAAASFKIINVYCKSCIAFPLLSVSCFVHFPCKL